MRQEDNMNNREFEDTLKEIYYIVIFLFVSIHGVDQHSF